MTDMCEILEWDSSFFGIRIARVNANRLSADDVDGVLSWCVGKRIDCLYFLGAADDGVTTRQVEDSGFRLVDVRLTYERLLTNHLATENEASSRVMRPCMLDDIPDLKAIARTVHHDTRFYCDPNFARPLCDALYETWIEKSCNGYADVTLIAEINGQASGYVTCHHVDAEQGRIGLLGVRSEAQGQGIGPKLIGEAIRWFADQGLKRVTVVTQARNLRAQRLYQRCSFVTVAAQLWFHRWFGE